MEGRLHRHPPEGRAQDQSPDAPQTRRPSRPRSRATESRCRLLTARCRGEPRQVRDARTRQPTRRAGAQQHLTHGNGAFTAPELALTRLSPRVTEPGPPRTVRKRPPAPLSTTAGRDHTRPSRAKITPEPRSTPAF